jgi:outer membrane lipase/esterase
MRTTYAIALLIGSMLTAAPPVQAQTNSTSAADEPYNRMVVFGDSLADGGYYLTLDPRLARDAGSFTTNPDHETYILADSVHPAGKTQRIQGQAVASLVQAPEQIAGLGYAAQAMFRAQRDLLEGPERGGSQRVGQGLSVFGAAAYRYYSSGNSAQRVGITERGFSGTAGADLAIGDASGIGIAAGYSDGTGDFKAGAGSYKPRAWSVSGYARGELGPARLLADGTYGEIDYRRIRRDVQLGQRCESMTARPTATTSLVA